MGAAYVVFAFIVLQAADLLLEGLSAPGWIFSGLVIATLSGFPLALALAWVFELTRGGIRRTASEAEVASATAPRAIKIAGLVLSILAAVVVGWLILR